MGGSEREIERESGKVGESEKERELKCARARNSRRGQEGETLRERV